MISNDEYEEEDMPPPPSTAPEEPVASLSEQLGFGVGTLLAAGAVDMFAHFGLTGLVVGGIAAYAASRHGPELLQQVKGARASRPALVTCRRRNKPTPRTLLAEGRRGRSQRSFLDRALGRFPDAPTPLQEAADDTVYIDEADLLAYEAWEQRHPPAFRRRDTALLNLSPELQIPLRDLAGKAIFICGIRRHGKTTLGALLAEQLGRYDLPLVIPDLEGDYLSLAEVLPRAVIAGHSRVASQYHASQFVALDSVQEAFQVGYDTLENGYQVILDLSSYRTLDEAIAIQVNVIRGLFHWTNTHPESRVPCHVYLDEAQRYLPQTLSDSIILDRGLLGMLLKCYMELLGTGGKRGLTPVVLTQRFAQVNNKIMAQSEVFFQLRQTHDTALDRCMEYVNKKLLTKEQIARFQPGQGFYIGSDGTQIVTRFHQRHSSGERSASPRPEAASRYRQMPLQVRAVSSRQAIPSADQSVRRVSEPPTMPPLDPARPQPLQQDNPPAAVPPVRNRPKTELERVLDAYRENPLAGYRELGEKLGMGKDKVGDLLREGRERGLLDQPQ